MRYLLMVLLATASPVLADWPQILGPNRDGKAVGETIPASIGDDGLPVEWEKPTGQGFAGVAVANGTVFLFHRLENEEVVEALSAANGARTWKQSFATDYRPGFTSDGGPRCVPIVHRGQVFVFGAQGGLRCMDAKTGEVIWQRDTHSELSAPEGFFGAGSTPLIEGDRIIVNVGGRDGAGVVAFSLKDGKPVWKSIRDTASYSSPIAVTVDGTRHVILISRMHTSSLDPENGEVRWSFPFGQRGPTVNGASPTIVGDKVLVTSSYGVGSVFARIGKTEATRLWSDRGILASQYATPIVLGERVYAVDGRQDAGSARLICLDPAAQKVAWQKDGFDYGTLIAAKDRLLLLTCAGELVALNANPTAYEELWRTRILESARSGYRLPALTGGRLFVRDDSTLKCVRLKP